MFHTLVTCPVCGKEFTTLEHEKKDPNHVAIVLLAQPERDKHRDDERGCSSHPLWIKGWNLTTTKINPIPPAQL